MCSKAYIFLLLCLPALFCEGKTEQKTETDERIIGGSGTVIEYKYWQISLRDRGTHICGGSIISSSIVLTAAHCLSDYAKAGTLFNYLSVKAGSTYLFYVSQSRTIAGYAIHPYYVGPPYDYDIALIQLSTPLTWTTTVHSIQMTTVEPGAGTPLYVSGWGKTSNTDNTLPNQLQATTLYVQSRTYCAQQWGSIFTPRMICAVATGTDTCQGDSGGPCVVYNATVQNYLLAGIVSYGASTCTSGIPSGYTNVANLRPWIRTYTGF